MSNDNQSSSPASLQARAEAAAWLAHLRGPDRTAAVERGFRRWLQAEPAHRQAFEDLSERMELVDRFKTRLMQQRSGKVTATSLWRDRLIKVAAVLAVSVIGTWAQYQFAGIATDVGEQRTLTLEDGSRVYINTDSRLTIRYDKQQRRVDLRKGEALFEVAKDASRPFIVRTGNREVQAIGTSFVVRRDEAWVSVTVLEGKVRVGDEADSAARDFIPVASGQRLTLSSRGPQLDQPAMDRVAAWRGGRVAVDDMRLDEAVIEMNRYSEVKLVLADPAAGGLRVGGFFRIGDSASFARAVAATYGLKVAERDQQIVILSH